MEARRILIGTTRDGGDNLGPWDRINTRRRVREQRVLEAGERGPEGHGRGPLQWGFAVFFFNSALINTKPHVPIDVCR